MFKSKSDSALYFIPVLALKMRVTMTLVGCRIICGVGGVASEGGGGWNIPLADIDNHRVFAANDGASLPHLVFRHNLSLPPQ